jgi:hypothetical protein
MPSRLVFTGISKDRTAFVFSVEQAKKLSCAGRWIYKQVIDPAVFRYVYAGVNTTPTDTTVRVRPRGSLGTHIQSNKIWCRFCRIDYHTYARQQYSGYLLWDRGVSSLIIWWCFGGGGWFSSRWAPYRVSAAPLHIYVKVKQYRYRPGVAQRVPGS